MGRSMISLLSGSRGAMHVIGRSAAAGWRHRLKGINLVSPFDPRAVDLLPDHRCIDLSALRSV